MSYPVGSGELHSTDIGIHIMQHPRWVVPNTVGSQPDPSFITSIASFNAQSLHFALYTTTAPHRIIAPNTMPSTTIRVDTPDGVSWHVEHFSPTPTRTNTSPATPSPNNHYIILIPSGEGDAGAHLALARLLSSPPYSQHVLTFDMPGFSRSLYNPTPPTPIPTFNPLGLAKQIYTLLSHPSLAILPPTPSVVYDNTKQTITPFGCSSGGLVAMGLTALYPTHIRAAIIHEVPLGGTATLAMFDGKSDEEASTMCAYTFANIFIEAEGKSAWEALGEAYHARLAKNYVTWVRRYTTAGPQVSQGMLEGVEAKGGFARPVFWTVGSLSEGVEKGEGYWGPDFAWAEKLGLKVDRERLRCKHFPGVTVPEETARWIAECDRKGLEA